MLLFFWFFKSLEILRGQSSQQNSWQDWFRIDPNFGTAEDMKVLVQKTHELGAMAMAVAVVSWDVGRLMLDW